MDKSKIIAYLAVSIDMKIADPAGDTNWLPPMDEAGLNSHKKFLESVHTVISGRKTFEKELALNEGKAWPDKKVYVFSRFPHNIAQYKHMKHVSFVSGSIKPFLDGIQKEVPSGKYIWVAGGGEFVANLLNENLIDILELYMLPLVLGPGIALFPNVKSRVDFIAESPEKTSDGMIKLRFVKKTK